MRAVREVIVEKGRAVGVVTETGETIRARAVISNLNPKLLYRRADRSRRAARRRSPSGSRNGAAAPARSA